MKIAIAWRADTENEFCTNVVEAFRLAGVNVTVLPQVKASHIDYEGSSVSANQLDADGIGYLSNDAGLLVRAKAYDGSNVAVGRQHGVDEKILKHIANAYRLVFNGGTSLFDAVNQIIDQVPDSPEIRHIVEFLQATELGIIARK